MNMITKAEQIDEMRSTRSKMEQALHLNCDNKADFRNMVCAQVYP